MVNIHVFKRILLDTELTEYVNDAIVADQKGNNVFRF